ncbi:MAG TPA: carboxylesterase family protein, partial [Flavisolibacter sp.]|nr:carboxylesterase family protein [Flavisolibacter sp.]
DGSEPRYDGESMAQKGIVALTVNYRLGVFGFFSHPELTKESVHQASGNYALLDQAAALKWVHDNIAAFGGDPSRVTIAGESAGSVAVSAQMASPLSRDLIAGAIGESGSVLGTLSAVPLTDAEANGVAFAKTLNATTLEELRKLPADTLLEAANRYGPFRFSATLDGYFFPKAPLAIYESGEQAKVPLLAGWNSEESGYGGLLENGALTRSVYQSAVKKWYGDDAEDVLKQYPVKKDEEVAAMATALASDRFIGYSTWKWITAHNNTATKPVYRYFYEKPRPAVVKDTNANHNPAMGAVHSAEIEYAMGNLESNKVFAWNQDDYTVSRIMQEYFANFIKTGNPNGTGLPSWQSIDRSGKSAIMHINVDSRVELDQTHERYLLLDRLAASKR